jgi:hypothetical protein
MAIRRLRRRAPLVIAVISAAAISGATLSAPVQGAAEDPGPLARTARHRVVVTGLDNPRQLSIAPSGRLLVAEAGHGGKHCQGEGEDAECVGKTGRLSVVRNSHRYTVADRFLSGAGGDGSFAVGMDGAGKRAGGRYFAIVTYAPPDVVPQGLPGWQSGKLISINHAGKKRAVADITAFERKYDPDGEGFDSNPYSVLVLKHRVLVADAAGDYIAQVRGGRVSLFAKMPEYGKKVDPVPTVLTRGPHGTILVGELHSEIPKKAKIRQFSRSGKLLRSWGGFTTITGIALGKDGRLYVSELFGGKCGFDKIPTCFPGRVVRVMPNGARQAKGVPFPAGIVVRGNKPFVNAFSVSPSSGFGGNPAWSGQIWRLDPW